VLAVVVGQMEEIQMEALEVAVVEEEEVTHPLAQFLARQTLVVVVVA